MADIAGDRISYKIDVNGLSQLDGMKQTIQQIEKSMPGLSKTIKSAQEAMKKLNSEVSSSHATQGIDAQKRGYDSLSRSVNGTRNSVSRTNRETETLGKTMTRVGNGNHFTKQSRDLNLLGSKMQSFGTKATVATAAIAATAGIAVKQAMNLQNRYKVIDNLAVTGGEKQAEAQKNVNGMRKQAITLSDTYGVSQKKLAAGYEILVRRGYTTNQALGAQKSYLQGAIASGDSYTDVVNGAASAIEQFGMRVKSVQGMAQASKTAINQMAYSADMTATSFADMSEALKYAGPDAHAAHQSLHTTVSAIGQVSNYGIDGSQAGTSLRQIYQRLVNPPTKGKAPNALKQLGLSSKDFLDAHKNLIPIQDVFAKLDSRMKGMSRTQKGGIYSALFGANASSVAQALGSSYKQVDALDKKVRNAQNMNGGKGYAEQLSQKNMGTLSKQWDRIKQEGINAGVDVANAWMPTLTKMAKGLADVLTQFNKLPEPVKKFTGAALAITAVVGPIALIAGSFLRISAAMKTMSALGGKKASGGLLSGVMDFLGLGGGKPATRSGSTHFSSKKAIPGSLMLNGVDWQGTRRGMANAGTKFAGTRIGRIATPIIRAPKQLASTLWSDARTITSGGLSKARGGLTRLGSRLGRIPGVSRLGSVAKLGGRIASRVPYLDIAMAGTNMIGMNSKNAGKKVGSAGGMLAGGAIGSMLGPIGGMAGAVLGQTLGAKFGAAIQKTIPKKVQTSLNKSIKSMGKTVKGLLTPFKSVSRSIGRTWGSATKGIGKSWSKYVVKPLTGKSGGAAIKDSMKVFRAVLIPTLKLAGAAFSLFGRVVRTAIKVVAHVLEGLIKTVSGVVSLVSDVIHGRWKNIWKDAVQIFTGVFGTIGNVMKDILGGVWDTMKSFGSKIGSFMAHPVNTVKGWFGGGKKHAAGTTHLPYMGAGIRTNEHAIVNDGGGKEMIVYPSGQAVIPNGRNVHMMLPKGSNVFNAADTKRLVHHANGTTKLAKKPKIDTLSKESKQTSKSMKSIDKAIENGYSKSNKGSKKQLTQIQKNSTNTFKKLNRDTKKQTQKIQTNTVGDFDDMQKGSATQMKQMYKGVKAYVKDIDNNFQDGMNKLPGYAQSAMSKTISALNRGFRSINTVLSQFGGSKATLNLAHYATGSKGPISNNQLAVVNDAPTGPHQEAIVRGGNVMFPKGRNVVTHLQKGDEVLNGEETRQAFGELPHYKKGTGGLKRLISKNHKNPGAAFNNDFNGKLSLAVNPFLAKGTGETSKGAANTGGNPWYSAVWQAFSNAMSGSGAGGPVTHSPGGGWSVSSGFGNRGAVSGGFSQHDGVDYSGARTVHSMNTGTVQRIGGPPAGWGGGSGIGESVVIGGGGLNYIYQELNGKYGSGAKILVSKGDQVKAGQAIAVLGSSASHVHVGATHHKMFSIGGSSTAGWLDPRKIKSSAIKVKDDKNKGNSALDKFVKKQLAPQIKWIGKNLSDDVGDIGSLGLAGSIASRARILAAAIKKAYPAATNAGIAAVLGNWSFESHLDPHAINPGGGASGLGQWFQGRKTALVNYAHRHHQDWKNAGTQLDFALHGDGANSAILKSVLRSHGSVAALASRFSSAWERGGYTPQHVAGARTVEAALHANGGWAKNGKLNVFGEAHGENEVAINTHRPSADPLLMEAMSDRASQKPNGVFAQFKSYLKMQREMKKMKSSQKEFNQNTQRATNPQHGITMKPQLIYNPQITINGASDAQDTSKKLSAELVKDRSQFASMMNDFCNMILVSQQ